MGYDRRQASETGGVAVMKCLHLNQLFVKWKYIHFSTHGFSIFPIAKKKVFITWCGDCDEVLNQGSNFPELDYDRVVPLA